MYIYIYIFSLGLDHRFQTLFRNLLTVQMFVELSKNPPYFCPLELILKCNCKYR